MAELKGSFQYSSVPVPPYVALNNELALVSFEIKHLKRWFVHGNDTVSLFLWHSQFQSPPSQILFFLSFVYPECPSGSHIEIEGISFIPGHGHVVLISLTCHGSTQTVRQTSALCWALFLFLFNILSVFRSSCKFPLLVFVVLFETMSCLICALLMAYCTVLI